MEKRPVYVQPNDKLGQKLIGPVFIRLRTTTKNKYIQSGLKSPKKHETSLIHTLLKIAVWNFEVKRGQNLCSARRNIRKESFPIHWVMKTH